MLQKVNQESHFFYFWGCVDTLFCEVVVCESRALLRLTMATPVKMLMAAKSFIHVRRSMPIAMPTAEAIMGCR